MKKFFRCPVCGSEFCLKGRAYCEDGEGVICSGQVDRPIKNHEPTNMDYAGDTIEKLRALRKWHKSEGKP